MNRRTGVGVVVVLVGILLLALLALLALRGMRCGRSAPPNAAHTADSRTGGPTMTARARVDPSNRPGRRDGTRSS
jgi:hypothetical protein